MKRKVSTNLLTRAVVTVPVVGKTFLDEKDIYRNLVSILPVQQVIGKLLDYIVNVRKDTKA